MAIASSESVATRFSNKSFWLKIKPFIALLKLRLSILVVFSGLFGYLLAIKELNIFKLIVLGIGSFCVTGAANILNQIYEKEFDKLMRRTCQRPLPTGTITERQAFIYASILGIVGIYLLAFHINFLTGGLSLLSLALYSFIYTPLKQITPFSVFIGAFPGALPPLIGWVAAVEEISAGALIIFGIQFFWQFPHFWAIAWIGHQDYQRAGFRMLPLGEQKNRRIPVLMATYASILIPLGILPSMYGITGTISAIIAVLAGTLFLISTFQLIETGDDISAKKVLWASFLYLPTVQIAYLLDKT
ncbi:MAG: heme o synthase [Cytophagales bacterium]|nr:heme o synthase [Cytophagales bacterium]MDW8383987.1 heme o synthase [Flammeovirgaceae bacterium]